MAETEIMKALKSKDGRYLYVWCYSCGHSFKIQVQNVVRRLQEINVYDKGTVYQVRCKSCNNVITIRDED